MLASLPGNRRANKEDALQKMQQLIADMAESLVVKEMTAEQAKKQQRMCPPPPPPPPYPSPASHTLARTQSLPLLVHGGTHRRTTG